MTKEYPWGKGTPKWTRDATADDSDKSFTVPAGKIWDLKSIEAQLTTTATVGNRNLLAIITDGTNIVWISVLGSNITASQVGHYGAYDNWGSTDSTTVLRRWSNTANCNVNLRQGMPNMTLPAGYVIRIYDVSAVDAAADDMTVVLHYIEYDA